TDRKPFPVKPFPVGGGRVAEGGADSGPRGAEIVPGRFVNEIKHGTDDKIEGGQTRRDGEFADHDVVRGEVQGRDDDPKGDGLGDCLFNPEPGRGGRWRHEVLPLRAGSLGRVPPADGGAEQRPQAALQVLGGQHDGTADQYAWDQCRLDQGGTRKHRQSHRHICFHGVVFRWWKARRSVMEGRGCANSDDGRVREIDRSFFGLLLSAAGTNLATRRQRDFGASSVDSRIMVKETAKPASDSSETSRHLSALRQRLDVRLTATNTLHRVKVRHAQCRDGASTPRASRSSAPCKMNAAAC